MPKQKIEMEPAASTMEPGTLSLVIGLANRAYARVPMSEIKFERVGVSAPPLYSYKLEAIDGREWTQSILFDRPGDPGMTFDVPGYWREAAEFAEFRSLRATLIKLVIDHGLKSFKSEWT